MNFELETSVRVLWTYTKIPRRKISTETQHWLGMCLNDMPSAFFWDDDLQYFEANTVHLNTKMTPRKFMTWANDVFNRHSGRNFQDWKGKEAWTAIHSSLLGHGLKLVQATKYEIKA